MRKSIPIITLTLISILLVTALTSAYSYYYPSDNIWNRDSHNNDNTYEKTVLYEEKESSTNYYPWGKETTSYEIREKTKIEREEYPYYSRYNSYNYPRTNYHKSNKYTPTQIYTRPSYTNYRYQTYQEPKYYHNTYTKPYYYEPRYDYNLGHYNWRY